MSEPVCHVCNDTHKMQLDPSKQEVMCVHCPVPCGKCATLDGGGPYCAATPCPCVCHSVAQHRLVSGPSEAQKKAEKERDDAQAQVKKLFAAKNEAERKMNSVIHDLNGLIGALQSLGHANGIIVDKTRPLKAQASRVVNAACEAMIEVHRRERAAREQAVRETLESVSRILEVEDGWEWVRRDLYYQTCNCEITDHDGTTESMVQAIWKAFKLDRTGEKQ